MSAAGPHPVVARPGTTITVGLSGNGRTIRAHVGDTLVVRLPGNPTTGYRWSVARIPKSLRLLGSVYVPSPPRRIGQGGTFVFRFKTTSGSGSLRLVYRRPWEESTPPLRTFVLAVRTR